MAAAATVQATVRFRKRHRHSDVAREASVRLLRPSRLSTSNLFLAATTRALAMALARYKLSTHLFHLRPMILLLVKLIGSSSQAFPHFLSFYCNSQPLFQTTKRKGYSL